MENSVDRKLGLTIEGAMDIVREEKQKLVDRGVRSEHGRSYGFVVGTPAFGTAEPANVELSAPAMQAIRADAILAAYEFVLNGGIDQDIRDLIRKG